MANKYLNAHWKTALPTGEKFILIALCDAADNFGRTHIAIRSRQPGRDCLELRTGLGKPTICAHLKSLERRGYIVRKSRPGKTSIAHVMLSGWINEPHEDAKIQPGGSLSEPNPLLHSKKEGRDFEQAVDICPICKQLLPPRLTIELWRAFLSFREKQIGGTEPEAAKSLIKDLFLIADRGCSPDLALRLCLRNGWHDVSPVKLCKIIRERDV